MSNHSCNCLIAVADSRGLFFIAAWLFSFGLNAQTAALNLQVERDSVGLGEPVALTLTSDESLLGGQHWAWPEFQPGDTLSQGWEILSVGTLDSTTSPEMEAGIRRSQRLVVLAWDTGLKVIEPFKLTPSEGPLVSSSPLSRASGIGHLRNQPCSHAFAEGTGPLRGAGGNVFSTFCPGLSGHWQRLASWLGASENGTPEAGSTQHQKKQRNRRSRPCCRPENALPPPRLPTLGHRQRKRIPSSTLRGRSPSLARHLWHQST